MKNGVYKGWYDGICKACNSLVFETTGDLKDYKNCCANPNCVNKEFHECYDTEQLEYYEHESLKLLADCTLVITNNKRTISFIMEGKQ